MNKLAIDKVDKQTVMLLTLGVGAIAGVVVAHRLLQSPERTSAWNKELHRGIEKVRRSGVRLLDEGRSSAGTLQEETQQGIRALRDEIDALKASLDPRPSKRKSLLESIGEHERALSVFMATLMAKGVSSYFQWRDAERARAQGEAVAGESSAQADNPGNA